jgi:hypothetical protein
MYPASSTAQHPHHRGEPSNLDTWTTRHPAPPAGRARLPVEDDPQTGPARARSRQSPTRTGCQATGGGDGALARRARPCDQPAGDGSRLGRQPFHPSRRSSQRDRSACCQGPPFTPRTRQSTRARPPSRSENRGLRHRGPRDSSILGTDHEPPAPAGPHRRPGRDAEGRPEQIAARRRARRSTERSRGCLRGNCSSRWSALRQDPPLMTGVGEAADVDGAT